MFTTRRFLALSFCVLFAGAAHGQWVTNGMATSTTPIRYDGAVGVGLNAVSKFEVAGSTTNSSGKFGSYEIQSYAVGNSWLSDNIYYNGSFFYRATGPGTLSYFENGGFEIRTVLSGTGGNPANPVQRLIVSQDGSAGMGGSMFNGSNSGATILVTPGGAVGIGLAPGNAPTQRLDVNGNLNVSGNVAATYQDVAEWVPASMKIEPGTVVVIDLTRNNEVVPSKTAYDTGAAGVVTAKPGLLLGVASPSKVQVATTGRVRVKVDASRAPIKIGDLLVTSDKPGMAMKSEPVEVGGIKMHRPGTLIGKALEPLDKGQAEILVLLSMQ
jgi:hypothetical protein